MIGTLYVVATPIGNLEDITERASRLLREVDVVACEDTRHTRKLLNHIGSAAPTLSYHEHNETSRAREIVGRLLEGQRIALVSDAGTPLISDPGYRLVALCRENGIPVVPVPGPSAVTAALSVAGFPTDRFLFLGFPPKKAGALQNILREVSGIAATLVFYVGPHDLLSLLSALAEQFPERRIFLIREMTKVFETSYSGTARSVLDEIQNQEPKGEYTLILEGSSAATPPAAQQVDLVAYVRGLMESRGMSQRDAIKAAAAHLGLPKRDVYALFIDENTP
ncbi:MAG TPA: 16S rRNA (cytidine(1402)-2'-O)-methyltransferase [Acidobacteriota bacterium]|nr:16S rRNA (cytidine(1402)-2'-O)-methyltransferase [Acidobacteriota bacterium]